MKSCLHLSVCLTISVFVGLSDLRTIAAEWPLLGRDRTRNALSPEKRPPLDWSIGTYNSANYRWNFDKTRNIRWRARLGTTAFGVSTTFGSPIVADGQVYIGTNGFGGHVKRHGDTKRYGCLLCFRASDGQFLWHYSAKELEGYAWHWSHRGLGSTPLVEGNRLWFVSNRWEVLCLDTQGFQDKKNDGPYVDESAKGSNDADIVWRYDMRKELKVVPFSHIHWDPNRQCSPVSYRDRLYVVTGNGTEQRSSKIPSPKAPSLVCFDKKIGKVLWTDASPGENILMGQFSSPLVAEINGRAQVIVGQGDGWVRSFDALTGKLIWKFDINAKESQWLNAGAWGTRNSILATPVFYKGRVYVGSGQVWEFGQGNGRLVCIDPTKTGDISSELAVDAKGQPLPQRRFRAVVRKNGEKAIRNPNSGLIWEFTASDENKNGKLEYDEVFHRTLSSVVVKNDLLIAVDLSGLVHCFHARTGKRFWKYDLFANTASSPLIVDNWVYVADEDGDVAIFRLSADPDVAMKRVKGKHQPHATIKVDDSVDNSPVFANGVLYIASRSNLWAIAKSKNKPAPKRDSKRRPSQQRNN